MSLRSIELGSIECSIVGFLQGAQRTIYTHDTTALLVEDRRISLTQRIDQSENVRRRAREDIFRFWPMYADGFLALEQGVVLYGEGTLFKNALVSLRLDLADFNIVERVARSVNTE